MGNPTHHHRALRLLCLALVTAFSLASCAKTDKIIVRKEGRWTLSESRFRQYTNDVLDTTYIETNAGIIEFLEDGTGTITDSQGDIGTMTWSYESDPEEVNVCFTISSTPYCWAFDVMESKARHQEWINIILAGTMRYEQDWVLDKAD